MQRAGQIKVQTLNIWHGQYEYELRLHSIAKRIVADAPDILCLQEVIFWADGSNSAAWLAYKTGYKVAALHPQPNSTNKEGATIGNAILTRLSVDEAGYVPLVADPRRDMNASAVWFWTKTPYGQTPMLVLTTHLSWGVSNEYQRLQEVIDINKLAKELIAEKNYDNALTILAGTFNTIPDADSIRFLTGRMAVQGAENFWTDCWAETEASLGETQTPRNVWIKTQAEDLDTFDGNRIPKRRIDYIFVKDWVFGQTGSPIDSKICYAEPMSMGSRPDASASDHYGVETILLDIFEQK
mgnify:FL=1